MKRFIGLLAMLFSFSVFAQSADAVTEILNEKQLNFGELSYLISVKDGFVQEDAAPQQALDSLIKNGYVKQGVETSDLVKIKELALVFAKSFKVSDSLMYQLSGGSPRYAFKMLKSDGIFSSSDNPEAYVSGVKALAYYTTCTYIYNSFDFTDDELVTGEQ